MIKKFCGIVLVLFMLCNFAACDAESNAVKITPQTNMPAATAAVKKVEETPKKEQPKTYSYIGNKNSGKLHYPNCASVKRMKESNKAYLNCTRSEALSKGYDPCEKCNP